MSGEQFVQYPRTQPDMITCPRCSSPNTRKVAYTWWGGALGPSICKMQKCNDCRFEFNRVTRQSTGKVMWIYTGATTLLALIIILIITFVK